MNEIVEIYQNDATGGNITISCGSVLDTPYFALITASIKASAAVWQALVGTAAEVTRPNATTLRFEFGAGDSIANANTDIPPIVINVNSTDGTPTVVVIQEGEPIMWHGEGKLMEASVQGMLEPVVTECALMDIPIQGILVQTD